MDPILELSELQSIIDLKGKTFGITRFGGGSHINTVLLAKDQGWLGRNEVLINAVYNLSS